MYDQTTPGNSGTCPIISQLGNPGTYANFVPSFKYFAKIPTIFPLCPRVCPSIRLLGCLTISQAFLAGKWQDMPHHFPGLYHHFLILFRMGIFAAGMLQIWSNNICLFFGNGKSYAAIRLHVQHRCSIYSINAALTLSGYSASTLHLRCKYAAKC